MYVVYFEKETSYSIDWSKECLLIKCLFSAGLYPVPKVIHFPRYNMKCSGENLILRGIVHVVSIVFLIISCYIAEIWIAFLTVYTYIVVVLHC